DASPRAWRAAVCRSRLRPRAAPLACRTRPRVSPFGASVPHENDRATLHFTGWLDTFGRAATAQLSQLPGALVADQLLTPPAVRPEMIRRWNSSTMMTSGIVTKVPAAMIAAYGCTSGSLPEKRAMATVTGSVLSPESNRA